MRKRSEDRWLGRLVKPQLGGLGSALGAFKELKSFGDGPCSKLVCDVLPHVQGRNAGVFNMGLGLEGFGRSVQVFGVAPSHQADTSSKISGTAYGIVLSQKKHGKHFPASIGTLQQPARTSSLIRGRASPDCMKPYHDSSGIAKLMNATVVSTMPLTLFKGCRAVAQTAAAVAVLRRCA